MTSKRKGRKFVARRGPLRAVMKRDGSRDWLACGHIFACDWSTPQSRRCPDCPRTPSMEVERLRQVKKRGT